MFIKKYEIRRTGHNDIVLNATSREDAISQTKALGITEGLWEIVWAPVYDVNEAGLAFIADFVAKKEKRGEELSQHKDVLWHYAGKAEFQIGEGNCPSFEISQFDSRSGHTELCCMDLDEHFTKEYSCEADGEEIEIV